MTWTELAGILVGCLAVGSGAGWVLAGLDARKRRRAEAAWWSASRRYWLNRGQGR